MRWKSPPNLRACLPRFHEKLSVAWKVVSQVSYGPFWGSPGLEKLLIVRRGIPQNSGVSSTLGMPSFFTQSKFGSPVWRLPFTDSSRLIPKLISFEYRDGSIGRLEEIPGVHSGVAKELEQRAVVLVGAALGNHIHLGHVVAEFSAVSARLNVELLQRVDGRLHQIGAEVKIGVLETVQGVMDRLEALPGQIQLKLRAVSASARLGDIVRGAINRPGGDQIGQLQIIAPVQRQVLDTPIFDDRADGGCLGIEG